MPVDDPAARQVVRRELDVDPVAGQDLDPVAPHLPGRVAEGLVAVVEEDLVHAVAEGLDDLPFELDLVFLACDCSSIHPAPPTRSRRRGEFRLSYPTRTTFVASGPFSPSRGSYSTFAFSVRVLNPSPEMFEKCTKRSFPPSSGVMNPYPSASLNPFPVPVAIYVHI